MSHVNIWVHVVWSTLHRVPIISEDLKVKLCEHIKENAEEKSIKIDIVNGYLDHLHVLMQLNASDNISKVVQLIKGESAFWANKFLTESTPLRWQKGYYAASIYPRDLARIRKYIQNQTAHHQKQSYYQELVDFCSESNLALLEEDKIIYTEG